MPITTCSVCGLRNEDTRIACLRCGDSLQPGTPPAHGPWREGDVLVVEKGFPLPERCVRCGAPSGSSRLRRRYYWHPPALYLLAIPALLVYAIVAAITRKSATLELGLCAPHVKVRRRAIVGAWTLVAAGLLALVVSVNADIPALLALAPLLMFAGLLWGTRGAAPLRASHIDDDFVRLRGAGPAFLRPLPTWGAFR